MYNVFISLYFIIGFILTVIWWYNEYKEEYEYEKEYGDVQEVIVILFLIFLFLCWPIKLIKDYFESFVN